VENPSRPGVVVLAVAGNLLFTQEQRGPMETVVCYDADTGGKSGIGRLKSPHDPLAGLALGRLHLASGVIHHGATGTFLRLTRLPAKWSGNRIENSRDGKFRCEDLRFSLSHGFGGDRLRRRPNGKGVSLLTVRPAVLLVSRGRERFHSSLQLNAIAGEVLSCCPMKGWSF
jgi:hypothetical protein